MAWTSPRVANEMGKDSCYIPAGCEAFRGLAPAGYKRLPDGGKEQSPAPGSPIPWSEHPAPFHLAPSDALGGIS